MTISVMYHLDHDAWWAESPDVPGWTVVGETFAEIRDLAVDGACFALESDDLEIRHMVSRDLVPWLQQTAGGIARVEYTPLQVGSTRVGIGNPGGAPAEEFATIT